ncbi:unnamed protein product, partial [Vitis vinifera]
VRQSARVRSDHGHTVLVTGGAGFVGSHVSAALKRRGDGVIGLDNFNNYYDPELKRHRRDLLERAGVFVVEGDINDSELLRKLFDVVAFTHVMHLAAQAVCKSADPQPAIQVKPLLIHIIIYTVFQLLACDFSPDFTYIDDIVKGCLASLDTAKKSTGTGGKKKGAAQFRIFNLGNTSPVDVSKLVSILEKLLKVKAKRRVLPMPRNGDVQYTHANISLAQRELGYKPTTDLESGLKKFVRWYITYQSKSKKKSSW